MKRMLMGLAVGAGAMYLMDPDHGAERRAKLFGFYSENKDTIQEYAQTAASTAVTVGQTAASTASTVAEKASDLTGIGADHKPEDTFAASAAAGRSANGKTTASTTPLRDDPAPGMGGTLSS